MSEIPAITEHADTPEEQVSPLERMRTRSKHLFGAAYRVEVGAAIADGDGLVSLKDLTAVLGDLPSPSSVKAELTALERAGLLARMRKERGESDRRVFLSVQPSTYWDLCREIRDAAYVSEQEAAV